MRTLDLHTNQLNGPLPADLSRLIAAQTINLSGNALSGPLPRDLGEAAALRTLDLSDNQLSGLLPWTWSWLTALEWLDLAHNSLAGGLPPEWSLLPALQHLDLSYNTLDGWLPAGYGQLTTLTYLDLSFNTLRGPLPAAWGNLSHLQTLNLNNNQLAGPLPAAWGTLGSAGNGNHTPGAKHPTVAPAGWWEPPPPGLYIDLSCNRLSGALPVELGRIHGLQALALASNQLHGTVPAEWRLVSETPPHGFFEYNLLEWNDTTQTLPPAGLQATLTAPDTVTLTWQPILFWTTGYYEISYASTPQGPFTVHGQTEDKAAETYVITGLTPGRLYYFRVRAFSPAHEASSPGWEPVFEHYYYQQNNLWSDYTPLVNVNVGGTPTSTPTMTPTATPTVTPTSTPGPVRRIFLPLVLVKGR